MCFLSVFSVCVFSVCVFSLCVFSLCFLSVFSVCVFSVCVFSLCFLSVFSVCVFSLCFLSVFSICVFSLCDLAVFSLCVFCLCFLAGFAFHRTAKNDTFLSINIDLILQWSGLADELLLADINTIKGWWSATSQLLWLQYKYQTRTLYFGLSGYPASSYGGILEKKHVQYEGRRFCFLQSFFGDQDDSSCRLLATWHTMTALTASPWHDIRWNISQAQSQFAVSQGISSLWQADAVLWLWKSGYCMSSFVVVSLVVIDISKIALKSRLHYYMCFSLRKSPLTGALSYTLRTRHKSVLRMVSYF